MLEFLGWSVILLIPLVVVGPYLRGRSDLITSWNLLLLGVFIYIGMGALQVAYSESLAQTFVWFDPSDELKARFALGCVVFIASLFFFYYWLKAPKRFAEARLAKWPPLSTSLCYAVFIGCLVATLASVLLPPVPVLRAILMNVSHKALVVALVFSLYIWRRSKSPVTLAIFLGVLVYCGLFSMLVFSGRRLLMSVVCVPVFAAYWWMLRYKAPVSNLAKIALLSVMVLLVSSAYSTFRWFNKGMKAETQERSVSTIVERISTLSLESALRPITRDALRYGAQNNVYYGLLTMDFLEGRQLETEPLGSLYWIACYPIPRDFWEEKPETIGVRMPILAKVRGRTNWGINAVGHGFLEGGYLVIILYALIAVVGVRVIDAPLVRAPDNPFLLSLLCITAPHTVGWVRGDIAIMSTEILEGIVFVFALGLVTRVIFGTTRDSYPAQYSPAHVWPVNHPSV